MTDILVGLNGVRALESVRQMTLISGEEILPGAIVRVDPSTGRFVNASAATVAQARAFGVALGSKICLPGFPLTALRSGVVDGFELDGAYDAPLYLSDTSGSLADSAGTVSAPLGRIVPGAAHALGSATPKLFLIEIQ